MDRLYFLAQILNGEKLPSRKIANQDTLDKVFNLVFITLGALAVLLFVLAGLRYVLAQGDPAKITQAKMRLVHIAIGLSIAALAAAVVNLVINRIG